MDNVAHTLFAGAMARAGLSRLHPGATAALLVGANLPDLDVVAALAGPGGYLAHHRGITHSLIGTLALVPVVAAIGWAASGRSGRRRRRTPERRQPSGRGRAARLLAASFLGLASHLALDATNAYGIRPFLPLDGTWYYSDWLAIIDPWMWFLPGALLYLDTATTRGRHVAWLLLWAALSLVVLGADAAADWVRGAWIAGLVAVGLALLVRRARWRRRASAVGLALVAAYVAVMAAVHARVVETARGYVPRDHRVALLPIPGDPSRWRLVYYGPDRVLVDPETPDGISSRDRLMSHPLNLDHPAVRSAASTPEGRAMLGFARFPFARLDSAGPTWRVYLIDARYAWEGHEDWGVATLTVETAAAP